MAKGDRVLVIPNNSILKMEEEMSIFNGTCFVARSGEFGAVIPITGTDAGYVIIQVLDHSLIKQHIDVAINLHFSHRGIISPWVGVHLVPAAEPKPICITIKPFDKEAHLMISKTGIAAMGTSKNANGYVTYVIGGIRITMPIFEKEMPTPEVMDEIFTLICAAIKLDPNLNIRADEVIERIFSS
jgi:hypothetical protein